MYDPGSLMLDYTSILDLDAYTVSTISNLKFDPPTYFKLRIRPTRVMDPSSLGFDPLLMDLWIKV